MRPDPAIAQAFGEAVRDLRRQHNLTQEELARRANMSRTGLVTIEKGHNGPTVKTLLALGVALGGAWLIVQLAEGKLGGKLGAGGLMTKGDL